MSSAIEHHTEIARQARANADTYRRYLAWSTDPAQREWAHGMAAAALVEAITSEQYAAVLHARRAEVPA